jgi:hypothetical protein
MYERLVKDNIINDERITILVNIINETNEITSERSNVHSSVITSNTSE